MSPDEVHRLMDAAIPVVAVMVFCIVGAVQVWKVLPWKGLWRAVLWAGLAVGICMGVEELAQHARPRSVGIAWAGVGFPVYLIRRYIQSAGQRAAEAERLRQARGQERRRASPGSTGVP